MLIRISFGSIEFAPSNDFRVLFRDLISYLNIINQGPSNEHKTRKLLDRRQPFPLVTISNQKQIDVLNQAIILPNHRRANFDQSALLPCLKAQSLLKNAHAGHPEFGAVE